MDLVTFSEEILIENVDFCAVKVNQQSLITNAKFCNVKQTVSKDNILYLVRNIHLSSFQLILENLKLRQCVYCS